jgi:thiamine transport system substrate-binding protein
MIRSVWQARRLPQFEQANNAKLIFLKSGDAERCSTRRSYQGCSLADVMYGVDNTFLSRALEAGIFERAIFGIAESIPSEFITGSS